MRYRAPRQDKFYYPFKKLDPLWRGECVECGKPVMRANAFAPASVREIPPPKETWYAAFKLCDDCGPGFAKFPCASKACPIGRHSIIEMAFNGTKFHMCLREASRMASIAQEKSKKRKLIGNIAKDGERFVACRKCDVHVGLANCVDADAFRLLYGFLPPGNVCAPCYAEGKWVPQCNTCGTKIISHMRILTDCYRCGTLRDDTRRETTDMCISQLYSAMLSNTDARNKARMATGVKLLSRPFWVSPWAFRLWLEDTGATLNSANILCNDYIISPTYINQPFRFCWEALTGSVIQLSPDRLDDELGYAPDNVRPVPHYLNAPFKIPDLEFNIDGAVEQRESSRSTSEIITFARLLMENRRATIKIDDTFIMTVLYQKSTALINGANISETRNARGIYDHVKDLPVEVCTAYFCVKIVAAGGRCEHTGIPVRVDVDAPSWQKVSPDRLDPSKPYVHGNIAMVCTFTNTAKPFPVPRWNEATLVDDARKARMDAAREQDTAALVAVLEKDYAERWADILRLAADFPGV